VSIDEKLLPAETVGALPLSACSVDPISALSPGATSAEHPAAITPRSAATDPTIPLAIERVFMVFCPRVRPVFAGLPEWN
jgi:hypothetical protein